MSNSISIISDGFNNLSDTLSNIVSLFTFKLVNQRPDKEHPYGHGRIEYMTSFIVSAIVLYAGITALIESVKKIINPETPDYTIVTLVILIAGIIVKFALGLYVKRKGKQVNSDSLVASGSDAFNDAILSISVLASTIIYIIFGFSIEAYVGVLLAIFIIKAGIELIKESIDNILETRLDSTLAKDIKKEVVNHDKVKGAFDLILNNYGPDKYLGSIHIELEDTLSVAEVDKISRDISRDVMKKLGVILHTVGVYSINTTDDKIIKIRKEINDIVFSHDGVLQMHGFYYDEKEKNISLDIIIDFEVKDREELYKKICDEIQEKYKDFTLDITLDLDISD